MSGFATAGACRIKPEVDRVDDLQAGVGPGDVQRGDGLRHLQDALAQLDAPPPLGLGVEGPPPAAAGGPG